MPCGINVLSKRSHEPPQPRPRAPTIVDVAAAAGVSIATVSRALGGQSRVAPALAERVRAAAARLGYLPDRRGRALVQRRSNSIGAVVPTIDNPIFARALAALQVRLDADGYRLLLASTEYAEPRELAAVQALVEHGVDGVVLVGARHHAGVLPLIAARGIPVVCTWTYDPGGAIATVGFDNHDAMQRLVAGMVSFKNTTGAPCSLPPEVVPSIADTASAVIIPTQKTPPRLPVGVTHWH